MLSCIGVKSTAVETVVFLCHVSQVQTHIQAVLAADPAPVAVVLRHQAFLHLLAHSNNDPRLAVQHPLQYDLVNGAIMLIVTSDGQVGVLLY